MGKQLEIPVIPVSHLEGHVLTSRFNQAQPNQNKDTFPLLKFPYLSVLLTGKHAEIVLNRGVGLHTVMGMSIDSGIGECIDKAFKQFMKFEDVLKDKA